VGSWAGLALWRRNIRAARVSGMSVP